MNTATIRCDSPQEAAAFCNFLRDVGKRPVFAMRDGGVYVDLETAQLNLDLLYREFRKERETR